MEEVNVKAGAMINEYILDGKKPVREPDLIAFFKWFKTANRYVAQTKIGKINVSTVFLCLDHSFGDGPPLLFETMVFGGKYDDMRDRYSTWEEAEVGHIAIVKKLRADNGEVIVVCEIKVKKKRKIKF